ncbi:uncharacterized protein [Manis javanica]|uniref:uncharacterized protein isoform X5 n=1 Tax=Manis javanica TaxID=9974 RepID=UPI003C6D3F1A
MAAPLDPAQVSGRSPRLPLSDPQRRGPAARTCGRTVTFDPSPYLLPAVSRSARMGSPRLRVRNPGVRDLRGCGRDLFPGGVGAAGPTQRTLYQEVMLETCGLLASLEGLTPGPSTLQPQSESLFQIPQGGSWPCLVVSCVPQSWSRVVG